MAYDIRDPYLAKEITYSASPDPNETRRVLPKALVARKEYLLVDTQSYCYVRDKNHDLEILSCTI